MSSIGKNSNSLYPNAYYPTIMHYQNVDSWIFMEESDETVLNNDTTNSCLDEHEIGEIDEALFSTTFLDGAKSDDLDASEIDLAPLGKDINSENKFTLKTDLHFPHNTVDKNIAQILFDDNVNDNKFLNTHLRQPYDDNTNFTFAEKTKKGECFGKNENAIIDKHNVHHHQQYALTGNSNVSDVTNFSKQLSHQTTHSNDYYDNNINSDNKSCSLNTAKNGVVPLNNTNLDTSNVSIYTLTTPPMDLIGTSNNSSQQHLNTADCHTTNDLLRESPSIKTLSFDLLKYGKNSDNTDDKIFKTSNKITLDAKKNGRVSGHFLPFMTDTTCLEKSVPVDDALQNFGQKNGNNYNNGEIIKNKDYYCGEEITTDKNNYNGISSYSSLPNHFVPKLHLPLETNDINNYTNNVLPSLAQTLTSSICFNIASFLPSSICQSTITDLTRDINNCNKTITPLQNNNYKPFLPPFENTSLITTNVSRNIPVQTLEPLTIISKIHEKIKPFEHCDSTYFIPVTSSCNNKRPFHQNDFPIANSTRIQLSSAVNHNNNDIVCAPHYVSINNNNPVQGKTQQCAKFGDNFINTATLNDIFDEPPNLLPSANIEGHDVTLSKHNQHASISNVSISDTLIDPFEDIILGEDALTASEDFLPTTANTLSFVDTDEPTTALDLIDNLLFDIDLDEFHTGKLIEFIPIKSSNETSPEETNSKISPLPTMNIVPNDINCSSALYKKREYSEDIDFGTSLPAKIKKDSYHSSVSKNSFDNTSQPSNLSHSLYKMAPNGLTRTYDGKSNDPLLSEWFKINAISLPTTHQNNLNSYFSEMLSAMQKPLLENEINEYLSTYYNENPDTFSKTNAPNTTNIISDAFLTDYMINGAMSLPTCMENVIFSQKIQCSNQSLPKNQPYEVNKKRCGSIISNNDSVENGSITPNTYLTSPYSYPISMIYQEQESNKEQQPSPSTFAASKLKQPALSVKSNTNASNNLSKLNLAVSNSLSHTINKNYGAPISLTPQTGAKGFVFNNFSLVNNMNFSQSYGHHNYAPTSSLKYGGSTYADSYGSTNFISSPLSYFSPSFEDPKNRKKLQNKLAAARYRQKKKEESLNLIVMERSLIEINQNLKNRVQCLTHEIEMLKQLLK